MAMFNFDNLAANLPTALRKDINSNNYKLLLVEKIIYDKILEIYRSIHSCLNIDNCTGKTLELWGERQQVLKGKLSYEQLLLAIKASVGQSFSDGTHGSVVSALAYILSCEKKAIKIKSGDEKNTVDIVDIPLKVAEQAKFTDKQIVELINVLLPAGVSVKQVVFSGTFELGETWGEQDAEKGLSDLERTVGGELGMARR